MEAESSEPIHPTSITLEDVNVQQKVQAYEADLLKVEGGPDPLSAWTKYTSWAKTALDPPQSVDLLQRCTRRFRTDDRYKEDPRFVRICVSLADSLGDVQLAESALRFAREAGVGTRSALLYEAHAIVLEKLRSFAEAETVYAEGVRLQAQPLNRLQSRWAEFSTRMKRRVERQRKRDASKISTSRTKVSVEDGGLAVKVCGTVAGIFNDENAIPASVPQTLNVKPPSSTPDAKRRELNSTPPKGSTALQEAKKPPSVEEDKPISRRLAFGMEDKGRTAAAAVTTKQQQHNGDSAPNRSTDDVTINTKLALLDVDAMFNSPLPFENNTCRQEKKEDSDLSNVDVLEKKPKQISFTIFSEIENEVPDPVPATLPISKPAYEDQLLPPIDPQSIQVRARVEETLAEWFAEQGDYHVIDAVNPVEVGSVLILNEGDFSSDVTKLKINALRSSSRGRAVYDVEFDTGGALTLKVQNPADPWELYILRRLASCSPPLAVPLARALYDAESVSYLIMNPYPRSSLSELVKKRSLGPELLAFYVAKLLETLEALHAAGVIHADVRTETVMISGSNIDDAGIVLVEFSKAVDTYVHPKNATFRTASDSQAWGFDIDARGAAGILATIDHPPLYIKAAIDDLHSAPKDADGAILKMRGVKNTLRENFSRESISLAMSSLIEPI